MTHISLPEEIQSLMAGYVLGDLDSVERQKFQQLLADHPELAQEVANLKETLSMLPYGLSMERPYTDVRSRLLLTAQQQIPTIPTPHDPTLHAPMSQRQPKRSRVPLKTRLTALVAITLGGFSVFLVHRVSTLETQLATTDKVVEMAIAGHSNPAESSALTITPADSLITHQWSGINQVLQDHVGSLRRSQGPVDIATADPSVLRDQLQSQLISSHQTVAQVPTLPLPHAQLLGGSPCQFSQTQGLRMTYILSNQAPISLYQIDLNEHQFPTFDETYITVKQDNVNLVLWRQDNHLYAIASELPSANLHMLTQVMELI